MSEANTIITAIYNAVNNSTAIMTYIKSLTMYEDIFTIEDSGKFPYINIDCEDIKIVDADNIDKRNLERHIMPVVFIFGVRNVKKSLIKKGDASFKSLFDIFDDLKALIYSDPTFSKAVNSRNYRPDFTSDVSQQQDGQFWIGRAAMIFEVYKDVFLK